MEALATELARLPGWHVTLAGIGHSHSPCPDRPYHFESIPCPGIDHYARRPSLPFLRTPAQWQELTFARALKKRLARRTFDLTLACSWPWTHYALRSLGTRHVFWTQNGDHMIASGQKEYATFRCDGLICTNPDYFARHQLRHRCILLPNGVDPDRFTPAADEPRPDRDRTVLVVSALVPHKRVDNAIRAVASVGGLRLLVCGDGPEGPTLDRLAHDLIPGRYQRLTVPRERMPEVYRQADVLLHPCDAEPSANVWSEALSAGLPVVAHDMPVTRWVLQEHGHLVNASDLPSLGDGLRAAVRQAQADPHRRFARHESARARLAWSNIAAQAADFMQGLLPRPGNTDPATARLGIVVIGRNEGPRLTRCLRSLPPAATTLYVDSGSTDGSLETARTLGAHVITLDTSASGFTAARGRNAGVDALRRVDARIDSVLFLDGDTELLHGFLPAALDALSDPSIAGVAGRRRERSPHATLYNLLCDMEWNSPVPRDGHTRALGGDALYRLTALDSVGGFNPDLIAGEEPELCLRLARLRWRLRRLPVDMTLHDAAMTRFQQWWRRHLRAGHAYAERYHLHRHGPERYRRRELRSILLWGGLLPALTVLGLLLFPLPTFLLALTLFSVQSLRVAASRLRRGDGLLPALLYGVTNQLAKLSQLQGVIAFHLARLRGKRRTLIEYKSASSPCTPASLLSPEPSSQP
jgi:glycosyltransferase involved in cell wall biosynthesis/GT2 family glycosyltransferase